MFDVLEEEPQNLHEDVVREDMKVRARAHALTLPVWIVWALRCRAYVKRPPGQVLSHVIGFCQYLCIEPANQRSANVACLRQSRTAGALERLHSELFVGVCMRLQAEAGSVAPG